MSLNATLNSTIGATFLGTLATAILYGVTSVQAFLYFQNYHEDGRLLRSAIMCLWILDTIHMAFIAHGMYFYLVTNFGNFEALSSPTWTLSSQVFLSCMSDLIVRSIFAKRISILCGNRRIIRVVLPVIILILSLFVFITGIAFASRALILQTYSRMREILSLMFCSLGGSVVADSIVAVSLCVLLFQSRTGIKKTDSLIKVLMIFSINTGLLTSICTIACFISFALWLVQEKFIFLGIYFSLSKLYVNSLLASLNARSSFRNQQLNISTLQINSGMLPREYPSQLQAR